MAITLDGTNGITTPDVDSDGLAVDSGTIKLDGNYPVGTGNVALGDAALDDAGLTGNNNVAVGTDALTSNTTASNNTAVGHEAGYSQTTADAFGSNTFVGQKAGYSTTGSRNSFLGAGAGNAITSGARNTIIGRYNGNEGGLDIRTSSNNIVLSDGDGNPRVWVSSGGNALFQGDVLPQIDAGFAGHSDLGDPTLRYEDAYVRDGVTTGSDEQDKTEITASDLGLDFITRLNPVSYKWNDGSRTHYGLIAQQLESVIHEVGKSNSDFAGIIKNSTPVEGRDHTYGIRYQELISPMIKAIQEQQATIEALEARITALEAN